MEDRIMRALRIYMRAPIDRVVPNGLSLYMLGAGLLIGALAHLQIAVRLYGGDAALILWLLLQAANAVAVALAGIVAANALRGSSSLARFVRGEKTPGGAVWFVHLAVLVYAVVALPLPSLRAASGVAAPWTDLFVTLAWTSLAGGALALALLNRLNWNIRYAIAGAVAAGAVFGCAVGYAPAIYGRDLQPLGWCAILIASIPALAFLAMFLGRYVRAFSESRRRSRGIALALFAALFCALAAQMALNPADRFGGELRAALEGGADEIRFSELTDFEWDTVEIYSPNTYEQNIPPDILEKSDIISMSYFSALHQAVDFAAFRKGGEIVHCEAVLRERRHRFKYAAGVDPMILRREDAVFRVDRGESRYTLTPAE